MVVLFDEKQDGRYKITQAKQGECTFVKWQIRLTKREKKALLLYHILGLQPTNQPTNRPTDQTNTETNKERHPYNRYIKYKLRTQLGTL